MNALSINSRLVIALQVIASVLSIQFIVCIIFYFIQLNQAESSLGIVRAVLQSEINSTNHFLLARGLKNLEDEGLIGCIVLKNSSSGEVVFRTDYDPICASRLASFSGVNIQHNFLSLNQQKWIISYQSKNSKYLNFSFAIVSGFTWALTIFLFFVTKSKIMRIRREKEIARNMQEITAQVIHDVASPLSALNFVCSLKEIPDEAKDLLKLATERTAGIIRDLRIKSVSIDSNSEIKTFNLNCAVDEILKEKSIVNRDFICDMKFPGVIIYGNSDHFRRILSNLLNNAIEATDASQQIILRSAIENGRLVLSIQDMGKGIPPHSIAKIGQLGFTEGKDFGSGLGLYSAIQILKRWDATLNIKSEVNKGTTVSLVFSKYIVP